jgi:putative glutamine amidotransferase
MKRIVLVRNKEDNTLSKWLVSMGFDISPSTNRMDSWVDGLVIGGGSDPGIPQDEERDKGEQLLISKAVKENIPVLGICRGAETVAIWGGGTVSPLKSAVLPHHQNCWHRVILPNYWGKTEMNVWSHHHLGIQTTGNLKAAAFSDDGSVEAVIDAKKRILGVMWHPERSDENGAMSVFPWLKWVEKRFK